MHWDQFRAGVYKRVAYGCANAAGIRPDIAHAADVRHWQRGAKASPPTNRQTNNAPHACAWQRWWSPSCNGHHASPRHAVYARPADTAGW